MDQDPHSSAFILDPVNADPDPGGKIFQIKTEKTEIANNCNYIHFLKINLHKAPLFLALE